MDDDANGLIKIKEVNEFTSSKPSDVSLMEWIAYCAYGTGIFRSHMLGSHTHAGWVVSMHIYRLRLEWIIERMVSIDYTKENSVGVTSYMFALIQGVVGYLRSMKIPSMNEQRLLQLVHDIMRRQESRLESILVQFNYEIEEQSTMSLLTLNVNESGISPDRVEGVNSAE